MALGLAFLWLILHSHKKPAAAQPLPLHSRPRAGETVSVATRENKCFSQNRALDFPFSLISCKCIICPTLTGSWLERSRNDDLVSYPRVSVTVIEAKQLCFLTVQTLYQMFILPPVSKQSLIESLLCARYYVHIMEVAGKENEHGYYLQRTNSNKKYNTYNMTYMRKSCFEGKEDTQMGVE